jgi:ferrochelatase
MTTSGRRPSVGVVLMSYGTPAGRDDVEAYYTDIRRGRPPTPEALADLVRRYDAIGGVSPLAEITEAQRLALVTALDRIEPGCYEVRLGFKHAHPKVEETAGALVDDGFRRIVGLVLAPHYSAGSIGGYLAQLRAGAADDGVDLRAIESWATEPAYVRFLADELATRLTAMRADVEPGTRPMVLFTAHALPQRVIDGGDPYVDELRSTAEAVAAVLDLAEERDWEIAWQSAGRTPEPWIGPDVLEVLDRFGATEPIGGVVVCACGFVADHLEVLYDLDIEAAGRAAANGLAFARTASVADDRAVMTALAGRVHALSGAAPAAPRRAP